jgi:hypothetical protein
MIRPPVQRRGDGKGGEEGRGLAVMQRHYTNWTAVEF